MSDDPLSRHSLAAYSKKVNLRDGATVTLRALFVPHDRSEVGEFFERIPQEDRAFLREDLPNRAEVEIWLDEIDIDRETVMVAVVDSRIVGTAVLERRRHGWTRHVGKIRILAEQLLLRPRRFSSCARMQPVASPCPLYPKTF